MPDNQGSSTRPYLLRALHEWCTDNGFTPYIAVHVDAQVQVPMEYVKNNEIVLNIGFEATSGLDLSNEAVRFRARFGGVSRDIVVPVDHVVAIYARENGQGMAFPMPAAADLGGVVAPQPAPAASPAASPAAPALRLATVDGADSGAGREPGAKPPSAPRPNIKTTAARPVRDSQGPKKPDPAAAAGPVAPAGAGARTAGSQAEDQGITTAPAADPAADTVEAGDQPSDKSTDKPKDKPPSGPRPALKRVK